MRQLFAQVDVGGREYTIAGAHASGAAHSFQVPWNFAAYLALRQIDLPDIQTLLVPLGLSSLGRCKGRVRPNLEAVIEALAARSGQT
jgi:hypothetical protein